MAVGNRLGMSSGVCVCVARLPAQKVRVTRREQTSPERTIKSVSARLDHFLLPAPSSLFARCLRVSSTHSLCGSQEV